LEDGGPDGGACGPCAAPMLCCGTTCVDPSSDPLHCGSCDPCPSGPHAAPTCAASTCGLACEAAWADCDGMAATGCESDLGSTATCGGCGVACADPPSAVATCDGTSCGFTCDAGRADCDGDASNGCEADLTSTATCGSCALTCAVPPSAVATCDGAACGFTCVGGTADCDGLAPNGCEADLTSIATCGSCGVTCTAPPAASATCGATGCGFVCDVGAQDCDGSPANGCEVAIATDPMNCGACGNVCAPGRTCSAGGCVGWTGLSATGMPSARYDHTAVWTGTEMIVWGGQDAMGTLSDGHAYNPATNAWRAISGTGAPSARRGHTAVWTGTEMVIWGGYADGSGFLNTGAAYDPSANTWRALSSTSAPSTRSRVPDVWTGTEMIVWGGWGGFSADRGDGARWRASTNAWSAIATTGAPSDRRWHASVWTGTRMLVFSGEDGSGGLRGDGFAYAPTTNAWSGITGSAAPAPRARSSFVWTAGLATPVMVVWGGDGGSGSGGAATSVRADGGRYDPAADDWSAMTAAPIAGRTLATAVWTGTDMIVWGGNGASAVLGDGAAYDPVTNTWSVLVSAGSPTARSRHTAVWTGTEMIVFGGSDAAFTPLAAPARYLP
nr:hypothetical protein [Myxococcota bacterium]